MSPGHARAPTMAHDELGARRAIEGAAMQPFIEFVCDAHVKADEIGPFVTRQDGTWAYCAGHGDSDHRWRRIPPTLRAKLEQDGGSEEKVAG
jgi:hypothetical protein